ncbi:MAG: ZIP family metal transporter [Patescibacteria group bacterium]
MSTTYLYTFTSIIIISLLSLIGVITLLLSKDKIKKITTFLVSFSAGTLLGGAALHLLPEIIEKEGNKLIIWLCLLIGIITFFILEKIIHWRHCHIMNCDQHPHPLGAMSLAGDSLHNFIDGMVIAGSFLLSIPLGIATSLAVIAHEIPQEIADFGVLIHDGYKRSKALFYNFLISLTAILGAAISLFIGIQLENFSIFIIPFAAGGFIYIATADLIPELKKDTGAIKSLGQLFSIIAGIGIMLVLKFLFE